MVTLHVSGPLTYPAAARDTVTRALAVRETGPAAAPKPRLLDRVRGAARTRHYSRRTEKTYVAWIRRYILFHGKRHPAEMGAAEITHFLTSLAVDGKVAAATQNQALSALLFLYREVLEQDFPWLDGVVRAKRPRRPRTGGSPRSEASEGACACHGSRCGRGAPTASAEEDLQEPNQTAQGPLPSSVSPTGWRAAGL